MWTRTAHIDGRAMRSYITPLSAVQGKQITTIKPSSPDAGRVVQQAWSAPQY
jgi:isoquinoline 1-oxidoreductase subunit alpha